MYDMTHSCVYHDSFICGLTGPCLPWNLCAMSPARTEFLTGDLYMIREPHVYSLRLVHMCARIHICAAAMAASRGTKRGGGLGSRPKKMYGERLGDGVEYHLMSPTPRC